MSVPIGRLMIVDDERLDHKLYRRTIERSGQVETILSFIDPEEALAHLLDERNAPFDVILVDVHMPKMSGIELLEAVVAERGDGFAGHVFLMLTTPLAPQDRERANALTVIDDVLTKPLMIEDMQRIGAVMGR